MESLPERGSLDASPLPELLLALYRRRFTGALALARDGVTKRFGLREGVPVAAESNLPSESLGIQLLDSRRITREDYARVVETVKQRGCKEGSALLALELVAAQDLFVALKEQVRRRLLDCFGWPRGEFALDPSDAPAPDAAAFRCDPIALAHEGVAIHWSAARIRAALEAKLVRFPHPTPRLAALAARLHRDTELLPLLAALDGATPLVALLEGASPSALAAVWVLDAAGAFVWRDEPLAQDAAAVSSGALELEIVAGDAAAEAAAQQPAPRSSGAPRAAARLSSPAAASVGALRREIVTLHASLGERDHYALLGIDREADTETLKRAYFAAAKRFHPDALARLGLGDVRAQAEQIFARIAHAYELLLDAERRRDYDQGLAEDHDLGAARLVQAEALFRKGDVLLRAGNFNAALEFLGPAAQLWPEEAAYQCALGWALYKKRPSDAKAARPPLERAIALEPNDAVAHFRLGLVLRSLGDEASSQRQLDLARRLDPKVR